MNETSKRELVEDLLAIGVGSRHCMIHSSLKVLRPVENGPAGVVEAFVEAVGEGTLLFPSYHFTAFTEQGYFDLENTPSMMGAISEAARARFFRTPHPVLSYAAWTIWSNRDGYFEDVPNAHGAGSVFDRFIQNDGLLLSIGADKQEGFKPLDTGFTASVHAFVEAGVDWRTMKIFEGVYVEGGRASIRKYAASVTKDPARFQTAVTPGHLEGERLGVIRRMKLGRAECWIASAREFHAFCVESCIKNPGLWRRERRVEESDLEPPNLVEQEWSCVGVDELELPTRVRRTLKDSQIRSIYELILRTPAELLKHKNFGGVSLRAVEKALQKRGAPELGWRPER